MHLLTFLPETIVSNDFAIRKSLVKRQLAVLSKVSDNEFREYSKNIANTLHTIFYFAPEDDVELKDLAEKVTLRYIKSGYEMEFNFFLDAVSYLPVHVLSGVKVKNVPSSFTLDFVRQNAGFTIAWDLMNPQNKIPKRKGVCKDDETVALLDDKSFVNEFMDHILDTQYEDELVDNEDFAEDSSGGQYVTFTDVDIALLSAFTRTPEVFEKSARKTDNRTKLCSKTKMAHEQIEGWAVMLKRNPNRDAILRRFTTWEISQNRLGQ